MGSHALCLSYRQINITAVIIVNTNLYGVYKQYWAAETVMEEVENGFDGKTLGGRGNTCLFRGDVAPPCVTSNYYKNKSISGAAVSNLHQICCFSSHFGR